MEWEWPIWKLCLTKHIPLTELKYQWSLNDIYKALDFLEMEHDYDGAYSMYDLEKIEDGK